MLLSKQNLTKIDASSLIVPDEAIFNLPEKVLQFGTGVLLRGLPDYFIDKANREGIFNGRIVVVKSTGAGPASEFDRQDGLYTLHIKGIEDGKEISEDIICSAISRVLSASEEWDAILEVAHNPHLQVVISNTTEVGIQLVQEDIKKSPPQSFPGKLLAVLYERYQAFNGSEESGLVVIPTELIPDNGKKLSEILVELAQFNTLETEFIHWIENSNHFCNSLVDRIVPGKPQPAQLSGLEQQTGYEDGLRIVSESYALWAIEGDEKVKSILSFSQSHKGVIVTPDIEQFRELKLRLLNGSHTLTCAIAYLSGFKTVKEAMDDTSFAHFIKQLMYQEIIPAIPYNVDSTVAAEFADAVLDRFRNPNIEHQWISISVQYSSKLKLRVVPLLLNHYKKHNAVPEYMALGFAAFLRFMKVEINAEGNYEGSINNQRYVVTDSKAETFCNAWAGNNLNTVVNHILKDGNLWGDDISLLPGFSNAIIQKLNEIIDTGGFINVGELKAL